MLINCHANRIVEKPNLKSMHVYAKFIDHDLWLRLHVKILRVAYVVILNIW